MHTPALTGSYAHWTHPFYSIRVRGTKYLWGSSGFSKNLKFKSPLVLHIHNDVSGEVITLGTRAASGEEMTLGTLQPGECVSIPVEDICGIFATCPLESSVNCLVH